MRLIRINVNSIADLKKPSAEELKHKSKLNERGLRLKRQNAPE